MPCPSSLPHPQTRSAAPPPAVQQSWSPPTPSRRKDKDATMDVSPVSSDNEEDMNVRIVVARQTCLRLLHIAVPIPSVLGVTYVSSA